MDPQLTALLQRMDDKLTELGEFAAVMKQQLPGLVLELQKAGDRLDALERDMALLKPLQEQLKYHEVRLRAAETSTLKLSTQAAIIASLIGSGLPLVFRLLGK